MEELNKKTKLTIGLLRIALGWIFIWAFFDKLLGLGFSTAFDKSWMSGYSPTYDFLSLGTSGVFSSFYKILAGNIFIDWLFMLGLLLIGLSLIIGIGVKIASYSGSLLMILMWSANIPPKTNPLIDYHIIFLLLLILFSFSNAGRYLGLGKKWSQAYLIKKYKILE
ncbi:MAG: hypothetical protein AABX03_03820 [Nanoarchaeota archaeon]